jgi:hypothetical protein
MAKIPPSKLTKKVGGGGRTKGKEATPAKKEGNIKSFFQTSSTKKPVVDVVATKTTPTTTTTPSRAVAMAEAETASPSSSSDEDVPPEAKAATTTAHASTPVKKKKRSPPSATAAPARSPAKPALPEGATECTFSCPEIGEGWTQRLVARKAKANGGGADNDGKSAKVHVDRYFFAPGEGGRKFRSMVEVNRFLGGGKDDDGGAAAAASAPEGNGASSRSPKKAKRVKSSSSGGKEKPPPPPVKEEEEEPSVGGEEEERAAGAAPRYPIGTVVSKVFRDEDGGADRPFSGAVAAYDHEGGTYSVRYEDGDEEDLSGGELEKIVVVEKDRDRDDDDDDDRDGKEEVKRKPQGKRKKKEKASIKMDDGSDSDGKVAAAKKKRRTASTGAKAAEDDDDDDQDVAAASPPRPRRSAKKKVVYFTKSDSETESDEDGNEAPKKGSAKKKADASNGKGRGKKASKGGGGKKRMSVDSDSDEFELGPDADDEDESIAADSESESESEETPNKAKGGPKSAAPASRKPASKKGGKKDEGPRAAPDSIEELCKLKFNDSKAHNNPQKLPKAGPYVDPVGIDATDGIVEGIIGRMVQKVGKLLLAATGREDAEREMGELNFPIKLNTACSGTDAPSIAMGLVKESLDRFCMSQRKTEGGGGEGGHGFDYEHNMSCEIEPFKQAYIGRNFPGVLLFPDITKLTEKETVVDVYGREQSIPKGETFISPFFVRSLHLSSKIIDHNLLPVTQQGICLSRAHLARILAC